MKTFRCINISGKAGKTGMLIKNGQIYLPQFTCKTILVVVRTQETSSLCKRLFCARIYCLFHFKKHYCFSQFFCQCFVQLQNKQKTHNLLNLFLLLLLHLLADKLTYFSTLHFTQNVWHSRETATAKIGLKVIF